MRAWHEAGWRNHYGHGFTSSARSRWTLPMLRKLVDASTYDCERGRTKETSISRQQKKRQMVSKRFKSCLFNRSKVSDDATLSRDPCKFSAVQLGHRRTAESRTAPQVTQQTQANTVPPRESVPRGSFWNDRKRDTIQNPSFGREAGCFAHLPRTYPTPPPSAASWLIRS